MSCLAGRWTLELRAPVTSGTPRPKTEVHLPQNPAKTMETASRHSSAPRSRSRHEQNGGLSQNIPKMFRTSRGNMESSRHGQSQGCSQMHSLPHTGILLTETPSVSAPPGNIGNGGMNAPPQPHLSMQDLRTIEVDIKETLSAAISELRIDIHALADRVHTVDGDGQT